MLYMYPEFATGIDGVDDRPYPTDMVDTTFRLLPPVMYMSEVPAVERRSDQF
jgi:hypothetical protein